jgi:hypothetical protein
MIDPSYGLAEFMPDLYNKDTAWRRAGMAPPFSCGRTRFEKKERCMIIYLLKRIAGAAVVLWAIITITFGLMHAIPGGPFTQEKKLPPKR